MKLIQITDLHLVQPGERLYGLDPKGRLDACIEDINANHKDAELCVITGDLTHFGDEASYALLRDSLNALTVPWHLLLGNHDNRQNFRRMFPEMPVDGHGFVQSAWETAYGRFLFLDTLEQGLHAGAYCERRQAWLRGQLEDIADTPVYIFMHHPPMKIGVPSLDSVCLMQRQKFQEILAPYRAQVRHLFFGHVHRPVSGSWFGIPFTALRGTSHQCWLDFEAEDQPPGSHEPAAYGIIMIGEDTTMVHVHDYLDESCKFPLDARPDGEAPDGVDTQAA